MKTPWFRKQRNKGTKVDRQVALGLLEDGMGRAQSEPPSIHNPDGGTRYHFRDPDTSRPVCNASGAAWAAGDGKLRKCGLCPDMWAARQGGTGKLAAS